MKETKPTKRLWEARFDTMIPERFDKMPSEHYETPLIYVEDGWSLLDAGCATANLYKYTEKRNISYTGMDFCQNLLDSARRRHPEANLKLGSVLDIPFPDNGFDVVFCKSVLEHIHPDEVKTAIEELIRVAQHMLILVFHNFPDKKATETHSIMDQGYWENTFSESGLWTLIKDVGKLHGINTHKLESKMGSRDGRLAWVIYLSPIAVRDKNNGLQMMKTVSNDPQGNSSGKILDHDYLTKRKIRFLGTPFKVWHSYVEMIFLDQILTRYHFYAVIEFGAGNGGITTLFAIHCLRMGASLDTFDLMGEPNRGLYKKLRQLVPIRFHRKNVFNEETINLVSALLRSGRSLIYCDNGDKPKEITTYAPLMKRGDIIMAHDKDQEIHLHQIEDVIRRENLKPIHQRLANRLGAGIFSFVKENI